MDSSLTRRGQKCWYRCPKVGMVAINDCFVLHSMLFKTLKRHFGRHPAYTALFELFIDTKLRTELGQLLDLLTAPADGPKDVSKFNMDLYRKIIRFKTAYYSFHLPVVASLIALDYQKEASLTELESILIDLGELFQIQDDFLDCYGDPEVMGKIGTDIQEGKCTWLIVKALENQRLTLEMRQKLELHYGQKDLESAIIIKDIYRQLDLESEFRTLEKTMKLELLERIRLIGKSNDALGAVLESFGCRIFGRKK